MYSHNKEASLILRLTVVNARSPLLDHCLHKIKDNKLVRRIGLWNKISPKTALVSSRDRLKQIFYTLRNHLFLSAVALGCNA